MSPNIGTSLNGVLIPNLLNSPFASWCLINLDFLLPHIAHFDNIIALPLLVLEIFGSMFSVFFLHFKQYDSKLYTLRSNYCQLGTYITKQLSFKKCIQ